MRRPRGAGRIITKTNATRAKEQLEAEERSSPSGVIVYKAVLKEGMDELGRPSSALFWSGLAAGLHLAPVRSLVYCRPWK